MVDAGSECVEAGQVALPDAVNPVGQALALTLGGHDREGADVPGEDVELGVLGAASLEPESFQFGEDVGASEDPSGAQASGA